MTVAEITAQVAADQEAAKAGLIAILPRVDAMNSFLRSEMARRHFWGSCLAHVVYHYKREALLSATRFGIATHRRAQVPTKCRDCGGGGRYVDSGGFEHDHCHRCRSSGHVVLHFIETTLPRGVQWLSPQEKAWYFARGNPDQQTLPETDQNWQIHQVGRDLTPSEVADHMNAIEAFFPKRPEKRYSEYGEHDAFATYTLWLGTTERGKCYLCGSAIDRIYGGHSVRSGRVIWNGIVCKACEAALADDVFTHLAPRMPAEFITPPIAAWIARHPTPLDMREQPRRESKVIARQPAIERDDDTDSDIPF